MEIRELSYQYGKQAVLKSVSAQMETRKITTIMGPNGCGKTTLFNLMTKNLKPLSGGVFLNNQNIRQIRLRDFAKQVAIVHQYNSAPKDVTVKALVAYGRTPYASFSRRCSKEDEEMIDWAMQVTDIRELKDKPVSVLSGGQRQRVWIAMALAQKTDIILFDEPTTYLDMQYQIQILDLIQRLNREFGITIIMILHDTNQALSYSDQIIGLRDGKVIAQGSPEKFADREVLYELFHIDFMVIKEGDLKYVHPVSGNHLPSL